MQTKDIYLRMHLSPRCTAHSKRTGLPCKNGQVRGYTVCRMHGARGGRPIVHGRRTKHMDEINACVAYFRSHMKAAGYKKLKRV